MSERYVGIARPEELQSAARQRVSAETTRALGLFLEGKTTAQVAEANGRSKKVAMDMPVAENLVSSRLINTEKYVIRRTERAAYQMLKADGLGLNTRKQLEYVRERCIIQANRRGFKMPKRCAR